MHNINPQCTTQTDCILKTALCIHSKTPSTHSLCTVDYSTQYCQYRQYCIHSKHTQKTFHTQNTLKNALCTLSIQNWLQNWLCLRNSQTVISLLNTLYKLTVELNLDFSFFFLRCSPARACLRGRSRSWRKCAGEISQQSAHSHLMHSILHRADIREMLPEWTQKSAHSHLLHWMW